MAETVGQHQQTSFTVPVNGTTGDADEVRGNDNAVRGKLNDHDADPGIHVQSSTLASRPAFGVVGRKWFTTDTRRFYYDSGSAWVELDYLAEDVANVFTEAQTFQDTSAGDPVVITKLTADGAFRTRVRADGGIEFSDGTSGTADITLSRQGANLLQVSGGNLVMSGGIVVEPGNPGAGTNSGASQTLDYNTTGVYTFTLTANTAFTVSNLQNQIRYLALIGDGTSRTPTWDAGVIWDGAAAPAFTGTAGRVDVVQFVPILIPGPSARVCAKRIMINCA